MTTDPLVSTKWLADHLHDKKVKVLDASFKLPGVTPLPKEDYERAHIPHAVFFDVDAVSDHSNSLPHMFPDAEQFGRDIGTLGISNADTVVVYDSGGWVAAPRAWWMFLAFGHDKVRVLDGGLKKWIAEGHPVQGGNVMIKPATFKATFDARRVRSIEQMTANLASRAEQVLDARAKERFEGSAAEPRPGLRVGTHPRQPQSALRPADRCGHRHDEAAGRSARGVLQPRRRSEEADRDKLRLRRLGRGADAGALSPGRGKSRALRRLMVGVGTGGTARRLRPAPPDQPRLARSGLNRDLGCPRPRLVRSLVVGWITVIVIIGSLLAASIYLVLEGARRWWDYLIVFVLTVVLVRPVLKTITGDMSAWLPYGIWSDGFDGKDQIIIASAASTILIPLVLAAGAICVVRRMIAYSRANRIR